MAKKTKSIPDDNLRRMATRYQAILEGRAKIDGPTRGDRELERAHAACLVIDDLLKRGSYDDARHLVGVVQGILLCKGIYSWEYLAAHDGRE